MCENLRSWVEAAKASVSDQSEAKGFCGWRVSEYHVHHLDIIPSMHFYVFVVGLNGQLHAILTLLLRNPHLALNF